MTISEKDWENYISKMSALTTTAGDKVQAYVDRFGVEDREKLIRYANALVMKYGEGSAELSCELFDEIAELSNVRIPSAEPADLPKYGEVAKAINGSLKQSPQGKLVNSTVQRLVKQQGADTTLKNASRSGGQFAWVPHGDTCPFCLMLASKGWQYVSKQSMRKGHAEHIHANCDCQYAVRFDNKTNVAGYDPDKYKAMFEDTDGDSWNDKINYLRREQAAEKRNSIDNGLDKIKYKHS